MLNVDWNVKEMIERCNVKNVDYQRKNDNIVKNNHWDRSET